MSAEVSQVSQMVVSNNRLFVEVCKLPLPMQHLLYACVRTLAAKGADYAHEANRTANFDEGAQYMGLQAEQVWAVYFWKHVTSLFKYCRSLGNESEPTWKRLQDVIVYCMLFVLFLARRNQPMPPAFNDYDPHEDS